MKLQALHPAWGITVIRVMAGIIIFVAALEKYTAMGFSGFSNVAGSLGIPLAPFWGVFIPLLELIGGALIIAGLATRWVAVLFVIEYFVTSFLLKVPRPAPFGGWDSMRIDLMLFTAAIALVLVGPGALALDTLVLKRSASAQRTVRAEPA
jgi:putative oxidoreductase